MELITPVNNFDSIHEMLMSSLTGKALMAAVRLKVFDALEGGAVSCRELSARLGTVEARTEPLLDLLAAMGLLERTGAAYANAPSAREFLVSSAPLYQGMTLELTSAFIDEVEGDIGRLLAGGSVGGNAIARDWSGEEIMEGTAQDAMGTAVYRVVDVVAGLDGFDRFKAMCDIGGNHGLFTMGVLDRNPSMTGVIMDLPPVAERAGARCRNAGYGERIEARPFNFLADRLPDSAFDLVLTSHFLYVVKSDLSGSARRIADSLRPGGWFVSHHYAGRTGQQGGAASHAQELLTRLSGYPSHFIEREELEEALSDAGFAEVAFHPVGPDRKGLITVGRKPA